MTYGDFDVVIYSKIETLLAAIVGISIMLFICWFYGIFP